MKPLLAGSVASSMHRLGNGPLHRVDTMREMLIADGQEMIVGIKRRCGEHRQRLSASDDLVGSQCRLGLCHSGIHSDYEITPGEGDARWTVSVATTGAVAYNGIGPAEIFKAEKLIE
jgi:hypothetical protein